MRSIHTAKEHHELLEITTTIYSNPFPFPEAFYIVLIALIWKIQYIIAKKMANQEDLVFYSVARIQLC